MSVICLDWSDWRHFAGTADMPILSPCRSCKGLTPLLDERGRPCHKVCAEKEIEARRD